MEVYTLTASGRSVAARTPEIAALAHVGVDEPVPVMVVPVVWATHEPPGGWDRTFVELPLTDTYLDLLTSRQRLAEYLAAVESDFEAVYFVDLDARLLSVEPDSVTSGALRPLASESADYAFLSAPLDEVRDTAAEVEVHRSIVTMVVGPVSIHWQVEIEPSEDFLDGGDGSLMLTAVVLPDEIAAAAGEFVDEDRGEVFDGADDEDDLGPN